MKSDTVFKQAFNLMLDILSATRPGAVLPSEYDLSEKLGVSRTTVRKVLARLMSQGLVLEQGRVRVAGKLPPTGAHFPHVETVATSEQVEKHFMEWMLRGNIKPDSLINEMELARQFGVGKTGIREFLTRFQRFGLVEKRPNAGWLFKGFTVEFATELFEIREMFEVRSALAFVSLPNDDPKWVELRQLEREHRDLGPKMTEQFYDLSHLDNRFHRLINSAAPNRFVDDFYDIVILIFYYHDEWNKRHVQRQNEIAIGQHLEYIAALFSRDRRRVEDACRLHISSAKTTLTAAMSTP